MTYFEALTPMVCAEGAADERMLSSLPPVDGAIASCGAKQIGETMPRNEVSSMGDTPFHRPIPVV